MGGRAARVRLPAVLSSTRLASRRPDPRYGVGTKQSNPRTESEDRELARRNRKRTTHKTPRVRGTRSTLTIRQRRRDESSTTIYARLHEAVSARPAEESHGKDRSAGRLLRWRVPAPGILSRLQEAPQDQRSGQTRDTEAQSSERECRRDRAEWSSTLR